MSPNKPPVREFGSLERPYSQENLEKARNVLVRAQGMDWRADDPPNCAHKTPCFPVSDVEWLFGYVDDLLKRLAHAERKWHGWHIHTGTYGPTCPLCDEQEQAGLCDPDEPV